MVDGLYLSDKEILEVLSINSMTHGYGSYNRRVANIKPFPLLINICR